MSFRQEGQRRYGHVPPVQYPVASQAQPQDQQQQHHNIDRRPSFNSGDDGAYYRQPTQDRAPAFISSAASAAEDELFLTSPPAASGYTNNSLSGYHHQYQDPTPPTPQHSTYNPQTFAQPISGFQRTQSTNLPYRQNSTASSYAPPLPPQQTHYTPQTYNPAAYASATSPQRQPTYHGYGSNQAYGAAAASQQTLAYTHAQSPGATFSSTFPQPAHSTTFPVYQPSMPSPSLSGGFSPQTPTGGYDPSQYVVSQYPSHQANGSSSGGHAYSQAPYPTTSQMPVGPAYQAEPPYYNRESRSNSQTSPVSSPGLQRHPTHAPLPSRPIEVVPEEPSWNNSRRSTNDYDRDQALLMQDIEAELGAIGTRERQRTTDAPNDQYVEDQIEPLRRYSVTTLGYSNSHASSNRPPTTSTFDDDDDDPEGTAGVLAMQQAEMDERRFSGSTFVYNEPSARPSPLPPPPEEQPQSSDSDLGSMVDLGMLSGGHAGTLTYGNEVGSPPSSSHIQDTVRPLPSPIYPSARYDRLNDANYNAQMDYGGTGGLQTPAAHRLSFDEGDEKVSIDSRQSGTESPVKDDYQDLFYHPGLTNRPLPALPAAPSSGNSSMISLNTGNQGLLKHTYSHSTDSRFYQHDGPDAYSNNGSPYSPQPERSISVQDRPRITQQVHAPLRSRTDAAEERKKATRQNQILNHQGTTLQEYETTSVGAFDAITLPSGRKRKFVPSKLNAGDFRRCTEPWALSGIESWVREMADGESDLREKMVEEALIDLFTFKVPTMNVADAEALSSQVVQLMLECKLLLPEEEWVKFGDGHVSGVLWQMTGSGCYAPKVHTEEYSGRCYSYHCTRTLKKVDLDGMHPEKSKPTDDWHVFYGLIKEDWESRPKKEVERQNILHEIVTGEENYIKQLDVFRTLYRDDLRTRRPPILHPDKQERFLDAVFGKLDTVLRINKDHLLAQLKYRQQEQGPWIVGFSDLFREWIRKAKSDYIEYATTYPRAQFMVRKEADRNVLFRRFLDEKQKHKSSSKQDWTHFLITPLQRLQRYILLLESIEGKTLVESEEKSNLQKAIAEIRTVTLECDAKVEETNKRVEMMELDRMLVLRPGFQSILNLDHMGRKLLMQGELTRLGSKGVRWVDMHALLFDHYLILAKAVGARDGREKKYDVSKEPIPMPLLFLESMNDEPIQRQKGITAPLARTATASASGTQLNKVPTNSSVRPMLEHVATGSSMGTPMSDTEGRILYPFRVKHLGHEVYTLYATSARDRMEWCTALLAAKTNHAKALFSQNAEPFRLRVLADAAFSYEGSSLYARTSSVPVKGTPLDRAIEDIEGVLGPAQGIAPVCRAQVNCATGFTAFDKSTIAIGTDYGVYYSDPTNPRGWTRSVKASRVTQIAVLEEFQICLVISDRSLISYPLDAIAPLSPSEGAQGDSTRRAPQRLAKDVTYFATAKMKDRMLVFYKRKEGLHTTFKVLEPIFHRKDDKKRLLRGRVKGPGGGTESFRDFDEFFFPTECYSLSLFQTYIAVSTAKGIEMLTLDKKQPMSIPDLKTPAIANIAGRISNQKPLGMFRLNDNEFLLTYEDCAVYVDKHGEVSRTLIMEYTGKQKKARAASMFGQYLLLFNEDYVEVRNAENGRLRQIIAGRDVRVLDLGVRGPTGGTAIGQDRIGGLSNGTVKISMCHPELPGRQIVLEMLLNDGHSES